MRRPPMVLARRVGIGTPLRWAGVAVVLYLVLGLAWLASNGWDPAAFAWFDRQGTPVSEHAREVLGRDVVRPDRFGHDGRWFWALAHDPLLLDEEQTAELLDRPAYRARRILLPLVAAPAVALGEEALLWWIPLANVVAVAGGTLGAAQLARRIGAPETAALAFTLNPAVLFAFLLDTADALAIGLVVAGLAAWLGRRRAPAVVAFGAAGLARELYLAAPLAMAAVCLVRRRIGAAATLVLPVVPAVAWALYVRARFGGGRQVDELVAPLAGFVTAWRETWAPLDYWHHFAVAVAVGGVAAWTLGRWLHRRSDLLMTAAVPFALLFPFLAGEVVHLAQNATRAIGPVPTLLVLSILGGRRRRAPDQQSGTAP